MRIRPREELEGLAPTIHGGQGWKISGVEDYSQNLNPMGAPPGLSEAVASSMYGLEHYPDADCTALRNAIAKHHGLAMGNIAVGAGSSEIIRGFPFAFLNKGDRVIVPRPSFAEYSQQIALAGAKADYMDLLPENDFHLDMEEVRSRIESGKYRAIYVCNPNNPTGRVESREDLESIAKMCEGRDMFMFLDETLLELVADEPSVSLVPVIWKHPNLLIARSFTKSFAVPGVRVGYGVGNPELITLLQKVRLPWNIGTMEQAAAMFMAEHFEFAEQAAAALKAEVPLMTEEVRKAGLPLEKETESFFYFTDLAPLKITVADLKTEMLKRGIMIRDCASFGYPTYIRFCVKDRERDAYFAEALKESLDALKP